MESNDHHQTLTGCQNLAWKRRIITMEPSRTRSASHCIRVDGKKGGRKSLQSMLMVKPQLGAFRSSPRIRFNLPFVDDFSRFTPSEWVTCVRRNFADWISNKRRPKIVCRFFLHEHKWMPNWLTMPRHDECRAVCVAAKPSSVSHPNKNCLEIPNTICVIFSYLGSIARNDGYCGGESEHCHNISQVSAVNQYFQMSEKWMKRERNARTFIHTVNSQSIKKWVIRSVHLISRKWKTYNT